MSHLELDRDRSSPGIPNATGVLMVGLLLLLWALTSGIVSP
jgi:hypothetical protein